MAAQSSPYIDVVERNSRSDSTTNSKIATSFASELANATIAQAPFASTRWWIFAIPAFLTCFYAFAFFTGIIPRDPETVARILGSKIGSAHVLLSLVTMLVGPFQFLTNLRKRHLIVHRWLGWIYTAAVTIGGISALYVSFQSHAFAWGKAGFAVLALFWLGTLGVGIAAARRGDIKQHQTWMTRNFALTYAAVELRWMLPMMMVAGMDLTLALSIVAWTCWVPNLVFVECFIL